MTDSNGSSRQERDAASGGLGSTGSVPSLREMFGRLLAAEGQGRPARTVELFGWLDLALGSLVFFAPGFMSRLLSLPPLNLQAEGYVRLVGLLVSGLGTLYIVAGRLNAIGFVFASLLDRPLVPFVMAALWIEDVLPGPLALAFSISDFGGFLFTLAAWRAQTRSSRDTSPEDARIVANAFGFLSGVVRNSRVFHPDGRTFRAHVRLLEPADPGLARASIGLAQATVLLRMGMGVMKKGMPAWLTRIVPDAPSIALRFFSPAAEGEMRLERRPGEDLDLLCTAGGDRLWKLILNLALGGFGNGLHRFDYFRNLYYAQVPYRVDDGRLDVWLRLAPNRDAESGEAASDDAAGREAALSRAVACHAAIRLEAQRTGSAREPFVPIAELVFDEEIEVDQEALHFDPVAGRGFAPHGFLTELRRAVYPASVRSRPCSVPERERRESDRFIARLARFLRQAPSVPLEGGNSDMSNARASRWAVRTVLALAVIVVAAGVYLGVRFTRDRPVEYADDVLHFEHGSTGGERTMGIPYWLFVSLPELFPEYLPDHRAGQGYKSFGMIYESGADPRYALPVGMSMRNFRGIDVVYLNCAVCHAGTVRDAPGAPQRIVPGMPANTFDLGAFQRFLTSIPLDEKFAPQRLQDQVDAMQDDLHRAVAKPDLINRLLLKYYAVPLMREKMLMLRQRFSYMHPETWGPGRVDTFNAAKALFNFKMSAADPRELLGNVDFPSVWNQGPREGMQLHWDGNNTKVDERNLSAAFGTGAYPPTLDPDRVLRTAHWLLTAKPPAYPYPVDPALAQKGAPLYGEYCASCHGTRDAPFRAQPPAKSERVGTVVPIADIGTDRGRLDSYTYLLAANQGTLYAGFEKDWGFEKEYPQRFSHFHKTQGYANAPLDGLWLRAPYLHNGSVPNLAELLQPAALRTKSFFRGNDVYDSVNVGFVSNVAEQGGMKFYPFDTTARGNGNQGHEGPGYGTDLSPEQKRALLEYLKTF